MTAKSFSQKHFHLDFSLQFFWLKKVKNWNRSQMEKLKNEKGKE